jgi:hypothetical protein
MSIYTIALTPVDFGISGYIAIYLKKRKQEQKIGNWKWDPRTPRLLWNHFPRKK